LIWFLFNWRNPEKLGRESQKTTRHTLTTHNNNNNKQHGDDDDSPFTLLMTSGDLIVHVFLSIFNWWWHNVEIIPYLNCEPTATGDNKHTKVDVFGAVCSAVCACWLDGSRDGTEGESGSATSVPAVQYRHVRHPLRAAGRKRRRRVSWLGKGGRCPIACCPFCFIPPKI
jgi:hypothetical protein